jgi:hypothetical protein
MLPPQALADDAASLNLYGHHLKFGHVTVKNFDPSWKSRSR